MCEERCANLIKFGASARNDANIVGTCKHSWHMQNHANICQVGEFDTKKDLASRPNMDRSTITDLVPWCPGGRVNPKCGNVGIRFPQLISSVMTG